jgi:isopentenyl-diphosphate Delta-isomerase
MDENLILVDQNDRQWGKLEKLLVHQLGLLHRAFSVFIFNTKGELLLQQRAHSKYHSPNLWTNTCCSHPRYGEELADAIERRLEEEMGMKCATEFAFSFVYKVKFDNDLTEHEFDHVYVGITDQVPKPEKTEVQNWKYMGLQKLEEEVRVHPEQYTEWLKICLPKMKTYFANIPSKLLSHVSL